MISVTESRWIWPEDSDAKSQGMLDQAVEHAVARLVARGYEPDQVVTTVVPHTNRASMVLVTVTGVKKPKWGGPV